ncbi:MAG: uracil-DNA glycosylase [Phycisphaera sp.]|nr:uracil-DNA glycosylase [Phycisphaera sp.]
MATQFRQGLVEVETDLLLGVEDVLLPVGAVVARRDVAVEAAAAVTLADARPAAGPWSGAPTSQGAPTPTASRRFEAELFAPSRAPAATTRDSEDMDGAREVRQAPAPPRAPIEVASSSPPALAPLIDRIVPPHGATNAERLRLLAEQHARECPHCTVATGHRSIVFGEGDGDAALVFVGEAPGETEDMTGRPFVGPAGEKLDGMISAMGLSRAKVYIANVLKTRPPGNRTPLAQEVERCGPYLLAQLAIIRPRAIVTLGGPASKLLLSTELGITRLRGVASKVTLGTAAGAPFEVPVMPTFHPAYLLRNYTPEVRAQVWSDLLQVLDLLGLPRPARKRAGESAE